MATSTSTASAIPARLVQTLREKGVKVRVRHYRLAMPRALIASIMKGKRLIHIKRENRLDYHIESNGGETQVDLLLPDGREVTGRAACSVEDSYDKRMGVFLAASRAAASAKKCLTSIIEQQTSQS